MNKDIIKIKFKILIYIYFFKDALKDSNVLRLFDGCLIEAFLLHLQGLHSHTLQSQCLVRLPLLLLIFLLVVLLFLFVLFFPFLLLLLPPPN